MPRNWLIIQENTQKPDFSLLAVNQSNCYKKPRAPSSLIQLMNLHMLPLQNADKNKIATIVTTRLGRDTPSNMADVHAICSFYKVFQIPSARELRSH